MKVSIIGPVPVHWGGGFGWRGGGISSHVQGVLPKLPDFQISVNFLADNSDDVKSNEIPDLHPEIRIIPANRSPLNLLKTDIAKNFVLFGRMLRTVEFRKTGPTQFLRFWGQAINYGRFLAEYPFELLNVHQAFNRQFICQSILKVDRPVVVTAHSINTLLEPHPDWAEQMIFTNYQNADWFIAVSNFVKDKIVGFGANPNVVTVVPNGVNSEKFFPGSRESVRKQLRLPIGDFLYLYIGNLIKRKGVDVLIRSFSQVNQVKKDSMLMIIGDGPQRGELEQLASDCGIGDKVIFGGYKDFDEMPLWYRAADGFVLASWSEGLSMSVLEAMASGCPVITSRPHTGVHDAIEHEKTGLLTDYGDVEQLAKAMLILASSDSLKSRLAEAGRHAAVNKFNWSNIARQTADVFNHVLERKGRY